MAGVRCETPRGAFYAMPTLPVEDAEHFAIWMLNHFQQDGETVLIAPGNGFYATPGAGRSEGRVAYVFEEEALRRALRVLAAGLSQYPRRLKPEGASGPAAEPVGVRHRL